MTLEEIAVGFIRVANEAMCRPIRALTQVIIYAFILPYEFLKNIQIFLFYLNLSNIT